MFGIWYAASDRCPLAFGLICAGEKWHRLPADGFRIVIGKDANAMGRQSTQEDLFSPKVFSREDVGIRSPEKRNLIGYYRDHFRGKSLGLEGGSSSLATKKSDQAFALAPADDCQQSDRRGIDARFGHGDQLATTDQRPAVDLLIRPVNLTKLT